MLLCAQPPALHAPRRASLRAVVVCCGRSQSELPRRALLVGAVGAASWWLRPQPAFADAPLLAGFSAGDPLFLAAVFNDLRYRGVREVVPGVFGPQRVRGVRVAFDPARIAYAELLKAYWREVQATQKDGQYEARGTANASAVWAATPAQRAAAEAALGALERSGVYGGQTLATRVLDFPEEFEALPEPRQVDAKQLQELRRKTGRTALYDQTWGLTTFCEGRVCGYVRFAKACVGECLDVFPEYRDQPGTYAS